MTKKTAKQERIIESTRRLFRQGRRQLNASDIIRYAYLRKVSADEVNEALADVPGIHMETVLLSTSYDNKSGETLRNGPYYSPKSAKS